MQLEATAEIRSARTSDARVPIVASLLTRMDNGRERCPSKRGWTATWQSHSTRLTCCAAIEGAVVATAHFPLLADLSDLLTRTVARRQDPLQSARRAGM